MKIGVGYSIAVIAVVAVCTLITRCIPFLVFGRKNEVPGIVAYLGKVLPAAIMAALVVYCLKNINLMTSPHGLPELISVTVVTVLHLWKRNTLLSIAGGTVCYMMLIRTVFVI